jgi:signal transduction histidine kinase
MDGGVPVRTVEVRRGPVARDVDGRATTRSSARLARLYLVLSRANRAIEQAHDEVELLQSACDTVVEVGRFRMGWAGLIDRSSGGVRPVAFAGHEDGYLSFVHVRLEGERSRGPTGQAVREERTIVCDDIATDARMLPWRTEALARGYRSSVGLPLRTSGGVAGVLTVYAGRRNGFRAGEVELLEELARDVSLGLDALEATVERHRAEARLAESERRFRTSIETLLDPFVIFRAVRGDDGRIVDFVYEYANEAACLDARLPRADLVGSRLLSLLPQHARTGLLDAYARVVETGEPLVLDDLDYSDTWGGEPMSRVFDIRASRLGDGLAYTWRDVTERRRAERRRAEELERRVRERTSELERAREQASSLARFSTAALEATSSARVGSLVLDALGGLDGIVGGALVERRRDGAAFVAVGSTGVIDRLLVGPPGEPVPLPPAIVEGIDAGGPFLVGRGLRVVARYPAPPGRRTPRSRAASLLVIPMHGGGGAIGALGIRFAGPRPPAADEVAFGVSLANAAAHALERIRLAEAEREARGMLGAVVAQMPVGVTVVARDGRALYRNAAYRQTIRGSRRRAPMGDAGDPVELDSPVGIHADGRPYSPAEWPAARSLASDETVVNEEILLRRTDGSVTVVQQTSAPIHDRVGGVLGAVVITLDVTERRAAEQLRDAFIGVLSHELRTPVTTIYAGARMLQSRGARLGGEVREEIVADIAAESERLSRLIEDLLVLARAERGVDLTARGAVLVQHRVRAVVATLAAEWPDRHFTCQVPEQVPLVSGDETYLDQVLRNLLGNAAKYGRREVAARVTTRQDHVEVSVLDDGPGIEPEELERVFELFARAPATKSLPGAGIGLFVARRLVEAMGGRLRVANRLEGGAAFTFTLPLYVEGDEAASDSGGPLVATADEVPGAG